MSEKAGILATLVDERSLEDKIEFQLNQVLADPEITNPYTDRQDKQNVLRRELILVAIATIIQHQNEKMVDDSKGATVPLNGEVSPLNQIYQGASVVLSQHGHFQQNNADDLCASRLLRVIGPSDHATIVVTSAMHMGMPKYPDLATFIVSTARKRMVFAICSMFVRELVVDVFMSSSRKCPTNNKGNAVPIKNLH